MFCIHCGHRCNSGDAFCASCGKTIATELRAPVTSDDPPGPVPKLQTKSSAKPLISVSGTLLVAMVVFVIGLVWVVSHEQGKRVAKPVQSFDLADLAPSILTLYITDSNDNKSARDLALCCAATGCRHQLARRQGRPRGDSDERSG
jgi:uncharacterized membrane protein YvbJ